MISSIRNGRSLATCLAGAMVGALAFLSAPGGSPIPAWPDSTIAWSQVKSPLDAGGEEPPLSGEEPPLINEEPPLGGEEPPLRGEEPPLTGGRQPAGTGGANAPSPLDLGPGEEPPLDGGPPPEVETGIGSLDDLVTGESVVEESIEVEPVTDELVLSGGTRALTGNRYVELLADWLQVPLPPGQKYEVTFVHGKSIRRKGALRGREIERIRYYEQRMLKRAADELDVAVELLTRPATPETVLQPDDVDLTSADMQPKVRRAIALLQTALGEHDSAVQRRRRRDARFAQALRQPLVDALFQLQIGQVRLLVEQGNFQQALLGCDRLTDQYREQSRQRACLRQVVERILLDPVDTALGREDYAAARQQLGDYLTRFPDDPGPRATSLRQSMMEQARGRISQARTLAGQNRHPEALALLESAEAIWPGLIGLGELRRELKRDYPVLVCAYSRLPRNFSPLSIRSAADRHAVALMFERLVQWREDERAGPHFARQLASSRPSSIVRGRRFQLPRCVWSDSVEDQPHYCTASDVVETVRLLKEVHPFGFPAAWEDLVAGVTTSTYDDPFTFAIQLHTDHWHPLSLMDFRIVPAHCFAGWQNRSQLDERLEHFATRNPVGTGPYRLLQAADKSVSFLANPQYRKASLPRIQEIRFEELDDQAQAVDLFRQGKVHLIHDVRREHFAQLRQLGANVHTLRARSISFLAPNYRRPKMGNESLRLGIACAIDRDRILDLHFRPPRQVVTDHASLTGPFPRYTLTGKDCWAYNTAVSRFPRSSASSLLSEAKKQLEQTLTPVRLTYPARESQTELACQEIANQLRAAGLEIILDPVEPHDFFPKVMLQHDYDLVYWRHDFPDETYWIWPFFDPDDREPGGANFMGLNPPGELRKMFEDMQKHKDFREIRRLAHDIHEYVAKHATFIPLWQQDEYVAVSDKVHAVRLDPIDLFQDVEYWSLSER